MTTATHEKRNIIGLKGQEDRGDVEGKRGKDEQKSLEGGKKRGKKEEVRVTAIYLVRLALMIIFIND